MATTVVQFRLEENLKEEASALFEGLGLDLPTAFRMFLKKAVSIQGIPFRVRLADKGDESQKFRKAFFALREEARKNGLQEIGLDEINEIIEEVRAEGGERE